MRVYWQLKPSRYAVFLILIFALLPLWLSFPLQVSTFGKLSILVLTPVFVYLLYREFICCYSQKINILTWQNGVWIFSTENDVIQGKQHQSSFTLGDMLFLSIKSEAGRSWCLWIFPANLKKDSQDWRKLHCCYYLSKTNN